MLFYSNKIITNTTLHQFHQPTIHSARFWACFMVRSETPPKRPLAIPPVPRKNSSELKSLTNFILPVFT